MKFLSSAFHAGFTSIMYIIFIQGDSHRSESHLFQSGEPTIEIDLANGPEENSSRGQRTPRCFLRSCARCMVYLPEAIYE